MSRRKLDGGDLCDGILADAAEADKEIEDEEADALQRLDQSLAVGAIIESRRGHVDDGYVERIYDQANHSCLGRALPRTTELLCGC